jgi:ketosteroid isomerase-like protein
MKNFTALCGAAMVALLLTVSIHAAPPTREADVKALKDNETQWNQDFVSKDVEKRVAHYADNAVLMAPGMPPSSGKEAIRKTLKGMLSDPALSLKFQSSRVEVSKGGDMGYTQGSYTMTMTDPNSKRVITDHGSYVTTYAKQPDGSWKAVEDIATSEVPPAAQASPAPGVKK